MEYDERDLAILTLTIYGESRSESREGKIAVAWTVRNRAEADLWGDGKRDWWGEGIAGVCLQDWQYTCFKDEPVGQGNRLRAYLVDGRTDKGKLTESALADADVHACYRVAQGVLDGSMPDPTNGATHYYADYIAEPKWARGKTPAVVIGVHRFYNDVEPGYEPPLPKPAAPPPIPPDMPDTEPEPAPSGLPLKGGHMLSNYRKAIAAIITAIIIGLHQFFGFGDGVTLFGLPVDQLVNFIVAVGGAFFVYRTPNTPSTT